MKIDLNSEFRFLLCGIFTSPDEGWMHIDRLCDTYELFVVTDGVLYMNADGREYTVSENEYLLTPKNCRQYGFKTSVCRFYWFHFLFDENGDEYPDYGTVKNPDTIGSYYYILKKHLGHGAHGGLVIKALLSELCQDVSKHIPLSDLCNSIKDYINITEVRELSVEKISKHFGYSPRYLSMLFKQFTQIGLKQFITIEKMSRAEHLLKNTSLKINDIGEELGYCDGHNFSHAFKKFYGISPKEYRKNI